MDDSGNHSANNRSQSEVPAPLIRAGLRRRPGKPPGHPKPVNSGRKKGTPNKATAEIRGIAQKHGLKAVRRLVALMKSEDETISLKAATELLDRAYGRPVTPSEISGPGGGPVGLLEFLRELPE